MTHLHRLPPELLRNTLFFVESLRDLHSLISASSCCLHGFLLSRNTILLSVLENDFGPIVFPEAQAIANVPNILAETRPIEVSAAFLEQYFSNMGYSVPLRRSSIISICHLSNTIDRLTEMYFLRTSARLEALDGPNPATENLRPTPLSSSERTRIRRAFFRYELYCRIFPTTNTGPPYKSLIPSLAQFLLFIRRMCPWEVEELSCIHNYFASLVEGFFSDLKNQFVLAAVTCPGARALNARPSSNLLMEHRGTADGSPSLQTEQEGNHNQEKYVSFHDLDIWALSIFDESHTCEDTFVSNLASFGLEFNLKLIDGDANQRKDMIRVAGIFQTDSLPEALAHSSREVQNSFQSPDSGSNTGERDGPAYPNVGYSSFGRSRDEFYHEIYLSGYCSRYYPKPWTGGSDLKYDPLREMGYVFWDEERIIVPQVQRNLRKARYVSRGVLPDRRPRIGESVMERLKNVKIPLTQMNRLVKEFGTDIDEDLS